MTKMMGNQQITYPLAPLSLNKDELSMIRNRRAVRRLRMEQNFASWIFRTVTISSIVSAVLFGIGGMICWQLEMNSQPIPTINNRQDWQTRKQVCFGWMLFAISGFLASDSLGKKSDDLAEVE